MLFDCTVRFRKATKVGLELLQEEGLLTKKQDNGLMKEAQELTLNFGVSLQTAKSSEKRG